MKATPHFLRWLSSGCLGTVILVIVSILVTSLLALQIGAEIKARPGQLTWLKVGLVAAVITASFFFDKARTLGAHDKSKPNKGL